MTGVCVMNKGYIVCFSSYVQVSSAGLGWLASWMGAGIA